MPRIMGPLLICCFLYLYLCCAGTAPCHSADCDHHCRNTPRGPVCLCRPGFKLVNNHTCIDINECEIYGMCDHHCVNNAGSYSCYCEKSYTLQEDGKTCKADGGEATLVFSSRNEIRGIYLDSRKNFTVVQNVTKSVSVAVDGNYIYWSEDRIGKQMILKTTIGTDEMAKPVVGVGIATDWITGNIYFTDNGFYQLIGACNNEGSLCTVLVNKTTHGPQSITVLPSTGMMYWCNAGSQPSISQAGMDGRNVSLFVTENLGWPNSVSIDYPNGRLYWVDTKLRKVESIRLDGTDRRIILEDMVKHPFSVAVFENKLYWNDWYTNTIEYCDKFTGKNCTMLVSSNVTAMDIHIDQSAIKPKFKNPCQPNPCSELCLLKRNGGYTCACAMGKKLNPDNHTCQDNRNNRILIFTRREIFEYYDGLIGMPKLETYSHLLTRAVTYDPVTGVVLLAKVTGSIDFYDPAVKYGPHYIVVFRVKDVVTEMAHDYISNNLYMIFSKNKVIQVLNLRTDNYTMLHFNDQPYNIVLVPEKGMMFVMFVDDIETSGERKFYVARLRMDGTSLDPLSVRAKLKNDTNQFVGPKVCACPPNNMLAADNRTCVPCSNHTTWCTPNFCINRKKWCDGVSDCPDNVDEMSGCTALSSCDEEQFMCGDGSCVDLVGRCDSQFDCADESDEKDCKTWQKCKKKQFRCNNGNCISIFLRCNGKFDCSDFSDEGNCRNNKCPSNDFTCNETRQCIPLEWRCDGDKDCYDGSDEEGCECSNGNLKCENGVCISPSLQCDDVDDCGDYTDEKYCQNARISHANCTDDEYRCISTNICIPKKRRCNGVQDCPKNDDEYRCTVCLATEFSCRNGKCIQKSWACDGADDCGDHSDEDYCSIDRIPVNMNYNTISNKCDEFQCSSTGTCLPYSQVCDRVAHCADSSDEQGKCFVACVKENKCQQLCFKTPQGGVCGCIEGYRLDANGMSCNDINECDNAICAQFCKNTEGSYKCSCFDGYVIRDDGVSCKAIGYTSIISKMDLETRNISRIIGDTTDPSTFVKEPTHIAVDWITNNVYYVVEYAQRSINVCNFEEMNCATVARRGWVYITSLLLDPINRWMFWAEVEEQPRYIKRSKIFRGYMNGTEIQPIISKNIGPVGGMAIDHVKSRLYWSDHEAIESSNLDGTDRQLFKKAWESDSLAIFENSLYVTTVRGIKKCLLYGTHSCETLDIGKNEIYKYIAIMHVSRYPQIVNPCENYNCAYMCILNANGPTCICKDGKRVGPNETCGDSRIIRNSSVNANSQNGQHSSSSYSVIIITLLVILLVCTISYSYYQRNRLRLISRNSEFVSSIRFQNPSYDRADEVAATLDQSSSKLASGKHEYANPIDDEVIKTAEECSIERLKRCPEQSETNEVQDIATSFTGQK
ncbi:hypothetical protein DMN91_000571 [Ooceraea biroi]|uniref:EGF-like domain-containing protein n=1 Tax=Ooceraea biroi TaxID=2015173 RepID=A0A3L8E260_OOCBI|nr:hypothetical protein DMN91_000571 [Ooceraea biroi]